MPAVNCRTRRTVRNSATALAASGWAGAIWSWLDHGFDAGINPGFIFACTVATSFTMVAGQWWALPSREQREEFAAIYALGVNKGIELVQPAPTTEPEPTRLHAVT